MRWIARYAGAWVACLAFAAFAAGQPPADGPGNVGTVGTIRGMVLDTRGGGPVSSVSIRLQSTGAQTLTDGDGRVAFDAVPAADQELYVSAIDFILVKRTVTVRAAAVTDVTIALAEGTGTYTEAVQVSGAQPPVRRDNTVAASQALAGRELQALRGVLANDPL